MVKRKKIEAVPVPEEILKVEPVTTLSEVVTSQVEEPGPQKCKWRKKGPGTFRLGDGRKIKPNEVFFAYPHEVPAAFRDLVELVSGDIATDNVPIVPTKFVIGVREDGLCDIVDDEGKKLNDTPMEKEAAEKLLLSLS